MSILRARDFDISVPVVVIGGGACGLIAAMSVKDAGIDVMVLERDETPSGSTALSSGFIPACETRWQRAIGVKDSVAVMAADIQAKAKGQADPALANAVATMSGRTLEWLTDRHGMEFVLLDDFLYSGHSFHRMHAHPKRTGEALMADLLTAAETAGVDVVTGAHVVALYADASSRVVGVRIARPDGSFEDLGCDRLILACNGYGGNPEMVAHHIPEMADAKYFGHTGNRGDAVLWGEALGGVALQMSAYQGHGSVATPHEILITWAVMMQGGIQVNVRGERFSNEHEGYSEQGVKVLSQPSGVAWNLYDARLHKLGQGFEDYRTADRAGAVRVFDNLDEVADFIGAPASTLRATLDEVGQLATGQGTDVLGRDFTKAPGLSGPPYHAVKVTGALFHTQGGLSIDQHAQVLRADGTPMGNLYAGGGAAVGVSGSQVWGYLSGNGLLTATALGRIAGLSATKA